MSEWTEQAGEVTDGVPPGAIMLWNGSPDDIPDGWTLCDGESPDNHAGDTNVPDLRQRFVVGAGESENESVESDGSTTTYDVGDTGGKEEHQLTEDEMPSHRHGYNRSFGTTSTERTAWDSGRDSRSFSTNTDWAGGDEPHENRPPYYALAYIMRLGGGVNPRIQAVQTQGLSNPGLFCGRGEVTNQC